jgi:L-histidine N-alpha-methyltransferase
LYLLARPLREHLCLSFSTEEPPLIAEVVSPVAVAAVEGLTATRKTLPPWLFYDEAGSRLFERITDLPEYYLTRTERALFERYADEIFLDRVAPVTIVELGAGTAAKTGILLEAATRVQSEVLYQPIDVSPSALDEAAANIEARIPGVIVRSQNANYITEPIRIERPDDTRVLALYIGSSIGNFSPAEARAILRNLRAQLQPGDALLLGTDLAPSVNKSVAHLLAAYNDAAGVTAAFNLNILTRLNREIGTDFALDCFAHEAIWNPTESRIEMHLVSACDQTVTIPASSFGPAHTLEFKDTETIHTENSHKFTLESVAELLKDSGFATARTFQDADHLFAVTYAEAV